MKTVLYNNDVSAHKSNTKYPYIKTSRQSMGQLMYKLKTTNEQKTGVPNKSRSRFIVIVILLNFFDWYQ